MKAPQPRSVHELDFKPVGQVTPSPVDWRDQVIYQVMIDRFDDDQTDSQLVIKEPVPFDPKDPEAGLRFKGGKIRGITRRLDYIQSLGCTTLWITPPFKNRVECEKCYHGYSIQNFLAVDPRFGTLEDLRQLIHEAHQRGMYVIVDIVINHIGDCWAYENDEHPPYQDGRQFKFAYWRAADGSALTADRSQWTEDDAVWPVELQDEQCYNRRGLLQDASDPSDPQTVMADLPHMRDLDLTCKQVRDALISVYKWWIAQLDCDGYRLDTCKHCDSRAVSAFVNSIRDYALRIGKHDFMIVAEVVSDDESLSKYIGNNVPDRSSDQEFPRLSALFDFPLFFELEEVIKGKQSPEALIKRYHWFEEYYRDYGRAAGYYFTFIDNHDQMHRSFRRFMHGEDDPRLVTLGIGYLLTAWGIPCVYYGTEQCLNGGSEVGDHYVRETMFGSDWGGFGIESGHLFNHEHQAYQSVAQIAAVRQREIALRYGRQFFLPVAINDAPITETPPVGSAIAFERVLDTETVVIVLCLSQTPLDVTVKLDHNFFAKTTSLKNLLTDQSYELETPGDDPSPRLQLSMQGREIAILKRAE